MTSLLLQNSIYWKNWKKFALTNDKFRPRCYLMPLRRGSLWRLPHWWFVSDLTWQPEPRHTSWHKYPQVRSPQPLDLEEIWRFWKNLPRNRVDKKSAHICTVPFLCNEKANFMFQNAQLIYSYTIIHNDENLCILDLLCIIPPTLEKCEVQRFAIASIISLSSLITLKN